MAKPSPKTELETALQNILQGISLLEEKEGNGGRQQTICFKVTQAEKERLQQRCSGIILSDYIRARLFDYPLPRPKTIMPLVNREVIYYLKCIGLDIKQQTLAIKEAVKTGQQPLGEDVHEYLLTLNQLLETIQQLRQEMIAPLKDAKNDD
jgi:hypothetical protein